INLKNGTFDFDPESGNRLRPFRQSDFMTYQLPFNYDPDGTAPIFQRYLDRVLPELSAQKVLAEYMGYLFVKNSTLKLEKALILFGTGANGKSVFFDVVTALLGSENVSTYTLQSLTDVNGYYRGMIQNRIVNYASEISMKMETSYFKSLVSGEPVEARHPYGRPFQISDYARLVFNCNELPRDVEQSHAFFRRFLLIPFGVTIPQKEQDKHLASKIIKTELSGVFNWILSGLERLLKQGDITDCDLTDKVLSEYQIQSDSVKLFLQENEYTPHPTDYQLIKQLYFDYRAFCIEEGMRPVNKNNFRKRLEAAGIVTEKIAAGNVAYLQKSYEIF
ncbi:MAG: DNA primase, partial [Sphingobacteriia bacterium]|nr:DNA primase [Sphingobacteriia bacterium]